jgi:hypothetical protein
VTDPSALSSRERGLMLGHSWAESLEADPTELQLAAGGTIPDDVRDNVSAVLVKAGEPENGEFWQGFADGVQHWLDEQGFAGER